MSLPIGVYKHYKDNFYRVLGTARDSENGPTEGRELVVYVSLTYGHMCVRPLDEFIELVEVTEHRNVQRFTYVGDSLKGGE